jgi:tyrosyl-tRNA synthetase
LFRGRAAGLSDQELEEVFGDVPSVSFSRSDFDLKPADFLLSTGAVKSKGEAARLIAGGGFYFENRRILPNEPIPPPEPSQTAFVMRVGKKSYYVIRLSQ